MGDKLYPVLALPTICKLWKLIFSFVETISLKKCSSTNPSKNQNVPPIDDDSFKSYVKEISKITNDVTGGLDKPDTGILFTLPIDYLEGLSH